MLMEVVASYYSVHSKTTAERAGVGTIRVGLGNKVDAGKLDIPAVGLVDVALVVGTAPVTCPMMSMVDFFAEERRKSHR